MYVCRSVMCGSVCVWVVVVCVCVCDKRVFVVGGCGSVVGVCERLSLG